MKIAKVALQTTVYVTVALVTWVFLRLFKRPRVSDCTMVVLGSGGHTREMAVILRYLHPKNPVFLLAETDTTSQTVILALYPDAHFVKIPRAREVLQSYASSIWSTLKAFFAVVGVCSYYKPCLLIANGPGTALPVILVCRAMAVLRSFECRIVFFESYCRIYTKSTTGKLCQAFVDRFVCAWEQLGYRLYDGPSAEKYEKYVTLKMFPE